MRTLEERRAASREYQRARPIEEKRAYNRDWERRNRTARSAYAKERGFTRKVRIPLDEVELLIALQSGVCAMTDCDAAINAQSHVDHEHSGLNIIRGVLCRECNVRLGHFEHGRQREPAFRAYLGEASNG